MNEDFPANVTSEAYVVAELLVKKQGKYGASIQLAAKMLTILDPDRFPADKAMEIITLVRYCEKLARAVNRGYVFDDPDLAGSYLVLKTLKDME